MVTTHYIINNNEGNTNFRGKVYSFDFDTDYRETKHIADRIISDTKFDKECKRNALIRDLREKEDRK